MGTIKMIRIKWLFFFGFSVGLLSSCSSTIQGEVTGGATVDENGRTKVKPPKVEIKFNFGITLADKSDCELFKSKEVPPNLPFVASKTFMEETAALSGADTVFITSEFKSFVPARCSSESRPAKEGQ
jgi:hypothetical protein